MKSILEIKSFSEFSEDITSRNFDLNSTPVDVESIATIYGLTIDDRPRFDLADKMGEVNGQTIWVNPKDANEYTALRRHIIAHELGHIVLHKPQEGQCLYFQDSYESIRGPRFEMDPKEESCNEFAAELLIPLDRLMNLLREFTRTKDAHPTSLFRKISEMFDVPISLAERRLISLSKTIK